MKTKLINIKGCDTASQVLVTRVEIYGVTSFPVEISVWHTSENNEEFYQYECVNFPTSLMAETFVADYSEFTANVFANDFSVTL